MILLEDLLTSPVGFGLVNATNVQRAICRIIDGIPLGELWEDRNVFDALGGVKPPEVQPAEIILTAGVRSGKSLIAAALAVRNSQVCDVSDLREGEIPRVSIVSLSKDLANVTYNHIVGGLNSSPLLKQLIVGEPGGGIVMLKHPDGGLVELKVVAGARAGGSLVGRWSAGGIFDEATRMQGDDEAVVNLNDARRAILARPRPGSQLIYIGSPWAAEGPIYEWCQESFGKPTESRVVIRTTGPAMNPTYWTKERCEKIKASDPIVYRTDVLGEFADQEWNMFSHDDIEMATRESPEAVEYNPNQNYIAAMDPATRGNAWAFVVMTNLGLGGPSGIRYMNQIVLAKEWIGSRENSLSPDEILREISEICDEYRIECVITDQWAIDALIDLGAKHGINIIENTITGKNKFKLIDSLRLSISEGTLELPPIKRISVDLVHVRKRVSQDRDNMKVIFPRTNDGRHCDFVTPLALVASYGADPPTEFETREDPLEEAYIDNLSKNENKFEWMDFSDEMNEI